MAEDYTQTPPNAIRRSDRAVTDDTWMKDFLHQAHVGTLATVHEGQPFINTNLFVYDEAEHCIYTHTARTGRTVTNVQLEQRVCFSVMTMGRLLPDKIALEFSVEYGGVTIFGHASVVQDVDEALKALQMLMDKYAPHLQPERDYRPAIAEELARTAVYRISIEQWSAKKKEVGEFEGAFWLDEMPILESVKNRTLWRGKLAQIFFKADTQAPLHVIESVELVAGKGLLNDFHFDADGAVTPEGKTGREVTLIALEDIEAANAKHNMTLTAQDMRRNLVTVGVPLAHLVGKKFRIGDAILIGRDLCEPCEHLSQVSGYGKPLLSTMLHRGGLRADILKSGTIYTDDTIVPLE